MASTLFAGDIAITGFNFDNPDAFSFVALDNIDAGTQIRFTDRGVNSNGSFRSGENTYTWTAPSGGIDFGEIVTINNSNLAFSTGGDQIIAYQGSINTADRFLYALNSQGSSFQSSANSSNNTALPPGLTNGFTAVALSETDNAIYSGSTTSGSQSTLLSAISNRNNWTRSNTRSNITLLPSGSTLSGGGGGGPRDHLFLGNPSNATNSQFNNYLWEFRPEYSLSLNGSRNIANWVSWNVNSTDFGSTPRQDNFRPDTALPSAFDDIFTSDYTNSGFDRGHITPSADRTSSVTANSNTFFTTNIIPQSPDNNQGVWRIFEDFTRDFVNAGNEVYVLAGGRGQGGEGRNGFANTIDGGNITVPSSTWKILVVLPNGDAAGDSISEITTSTRVIALDIPNVQGVRNTPWQNFRVSVNDLEARTGFNFLSNVPDSIENELERRIDSGSTSLTSNAFSAGFSNDTSFFSDELLGSGSTIESITPNESNDLTKSTGDDVFYKGFGGITSLYKNNPDPLQEQFITLTPDGAFSELG